MICNANFFKKYSVFYSIFSIFVFGCQTDTVKVCQSNISVENKIRSAVPFNRPKNFLFYIESIDGKTILINQEKSHTGVEYMSGSTSKLVATVVILSLVDRGYLKLESLLKDIMKDEWSSEFESLNDIKLSHLLNFTSGLNVEPEPECLLGIQTSIKNCVKYILKSNKFKKEKAGESFSYGRNHLQVAGLMAIKARGFQTWQQIFEEFQKKTKLFLHSSFSHPSKLNPMLAGGMLWTAADYIEFMRALIQNKILSRELTRTILKGQTEKIIAAKEGSPPIDKLSQDWHYGYGLWLECYSAKFNCFDRNNILSNPGLFGSYPFIEQQGHYFGLIAQESEPIDFIQQLKNFQKIKPFLDSWALGKCNHN